LSLSAKALISLVVLAGTCVLLYAAIRPTSRNIAQFICYLLIAILACSAIGIGDRIVAAPAPPAAAPPLPSSFFGTLTRAGAKVATGTDVSAWIGDTRVAETASFEADGVSVYRIDVPGDFLETPAADRVEALPPGFEPIASTASAPYAAIEDRRRHLYAVQFHPEVVHTPNGQEMLRRFLYDICGCSPSWTMASVIAHEYPRTWVKVLVYGAAATVSVARFTGREHFASDIAVGSVLGYLIGRHVFHAHCSAEFSEECR
jgi:hypothetical protein